MKKHDWISLFCLVLLLILGSCSDMFSPLALEDTLPAAPDGLQAIAGDGQVTLSWNEVSGANSYLIYYKANATTVTVSDNLATNVTFNEASAVVILPNGTYAFIVVAVNSVGAGSPSAAVTATLATLLTPPAAPTGLQAIAGDGQVTLSWNAVSGANSYLIYYKANATTATVSDSLTTNVAFNGASAVVTLPNGSYAFIVVAVNSAGTGSPSAVVTATLATQPGNSSLTLTGSLLGDFTLNFTLTAGAPIGSPDTSGIYPVYTIPRSSLPLTISVSSTPAASGYKWLLDNIDLSMTASSVILTGSNLSARKHNLTLLLASGNDPWRSATIILDTTN